VLLGVDCGFQSSDSIVELQIDSKEDGLKVANIRRVQTQKKILQMQRSAHSEAVFVEFADGSISHFVAGQEEAEITLQPFRFEDGTAGLVSPCQWLSSVAIGGEEVLVALNDRSKLFINRKLVSSECNSFAFHSKFLAYTTVSSTLRFIRLSPSFKGSDSSAGCCRFSLSFVFPDYNRRKCGNGNESQCKAI
jgi:hypothetical protein